ncbi:unnamed protein product [Dibothriocephalus latus]|uniref:Uncharacterized protein n=1 Tax=Dibothriocephalus latus TaxID=60516 RepID=A0A3P7P3L2_DIBLA|nr:unnamed protein product [Dibothriocephalus latus]
MSTAGLEDRLDARVSRPSIRSTSEYNHQLVVETDAGQSLTSKLEDRHSDEKNHADGKPSLMPEQQNVSPHSAEDIVIAKPASSVNPAGDELNLSASKFQRSGPSEEQPLRSSPRPTVSPSIKELSNQNKPLVEINDRPSGSKEIERFSPPDVVLRQQEDDQDQRQQRHPEEEVEDIGEHYDNDDNGQLTSESSQDADLADENSDAAIDPMILKYMAIVKEQQQSLQKQLQQQKDSEEGRGSKEGKGFDAQEHPATAKKPTLEDFLTNDQFESDRSARPESVLAPRPTSKSADEQR